MTCLFIIVPLISMFLPMYIFKNSSYVEMVLRYVYIYAHALVGTCRFLNCKDSARLHCFCFAPLNIMISLLDIGANKPRLEAPYARFLHFIPMPYFRCQFIVDKQYFSWQ